MSLVVFALYLMTVFLIQIGTVDLAREETTTLGRRVAVIYCLPGIALGCYIVAAFLAARHRDASTFGDAREALHEYVKDEWREGV